ncbi:hypothetical protein HDV00_006065 [Rhizophlyctis rosea]|nr:hypothetical protein HDV00_006065 [Rhizophlyctis rosea]
MLQLLKLLPQTRFTHIIDLVPALWDQVSGHGPKSVAKNVLEDAFDALVERAGYQLVKMNTLAMSAPSPEEDEGVDVRNQAPKVPASMNDGPRLDDMDVKNVVAIGGSILGQAITLLLRQTPLPPTHRLLIIERHSHAHYMFAFPRAATIPGIENHLFAPYTNMFPNPSHGRVIHALATKITPTHVELDREVDGVKKVGYEYLVMATGARHPEPGNLNDCDTKEEGVKTLKRYQSLIAASTHPLIIGGGAVGIELAAEIKEHFSEKKVTLVHSRDRYLGAYKVDMHQRCFRVLQKLGVEQVLGDRIDVPKGGFVRDGVRREFRTRRGSVIESDLVLLCTGMQPNSSLLTTLSPTSLSPSRFVLVRPTLQLKDLSFPNIFAGGDVIDVPDIKTGSSAFNHAETIIENIRRLIREKERGREAGEVKEEELRLNEPILPQIYLFLGNRHGMAQLSFKGYLYTAGTWLVRRYFSENVLASRMWDWVGTPLNKQTENL